MQLILIIGKYRLFLTFFHLVHVNLNKWLKKLRILNSTVQTSHKIYNRMQNILKSTNLKSTYMNNRLQIFSGHSDYTTTTYQHSRTLLYKFEIIRTILRFFCCDRTLHFTTDLRSHSIGNKYWAGLSNDPLDILTLSWQMCPSLPRMTSVTWPNVCQYHYQQVPSLLTKSAHQKF